MDTQLTLLAGIIGGWELLLIGLVLITMVLVVGGLIIVGIWLSHRGKTPASPVTIPSQPKPAPPVEHTVRICKSCRAPLPSGAPEGLCPQCLMKVGLGSEPAASKPAAGAAPNENPPPSPVEIARHFPQLEILELLGQGGMGIVYKARQPNLDRIVAIKILSAESSRDPAFAERFQREAKALAKLNHPNIVSVYDFGQAGPYYFFLMEYVDGVNLAQLEHSRRLTPAEALALVPKVCDALQYAHDEGVVHRDIKPGNILLDKKGRVKIADFGLAKLLGKENPDFTLTATGMVMGTPRYMAPEQMERPTEVDHRADIYSLGVVFYEMLTGELPTGRFPLPSQRVRVDVRLDEVVLRSLERDVHRRYQHASDVKTDVETITNSAIASEKSPSPVGTLGSRGTNPGGTFPMRFWWRDPVDVLVTLLGTAWLVSVFWLLPTVIIYSVTVLAGMSAGQVSNLAIAGGCFVFLGVFAVLTAGSPQSVCVDDDGITIHRFVGPSKFLPWASIRRIEPLSRWNVFRHVYLWPGLPPRGSIMCGTTLHVYRIDSQNDCWYFSPRHLQPFLSAIGHSPLGNKAKLAGETIAQETAAASPRRNVPRQILLWTAVAGIALVVAGVAATLALPAWVNFQKRHAAKSQPIFYTFAGYTDIAKGPDGPVLSDAFIKKMGFTPAQVGELNKTITACYREFVSFERQHSEVSKDARGHVRVTIAPFPDESLALAKRLAADLRGILGRDVIPQEPARGSLMQIGLFRHSGEFTVTAELWKENGRYHFHEDLVPAAGVPQPARNRGSSGNSLKDALPEEYWIYWNESSSGFPNTSSAPVATVPGAADILHKMEQKYESLTSLIATGRIYSVVETTNGTATFTNEHAFTIKLARPEFYRIDWVQKINLGFTNISMQGAAWYSGKDHCLLIPGGKANTVLNREQALAMTAGVSGGAAHQLPNLFFKDKSTGWVKSLTSPARQPDEMVGAEDCHVLSAGSPTGKTTLWIAKKNFLLKQINYDIDGTTPAKAATEPLELSDVSAKTILKAVGQEPTPEAITRLRAQTKARQQSSRGFHITITQTFESTLTDELMSKEDFEQPAAASSPAPAK